MFFQRQDESLASSGPNGTWIFHRNEQIEVWTALQEEIGVAHEAKDRAEQERLLKQYIAQVRLCQPIHNTMMGFVADTLEQFICGQGVVKVSDVLGSAPRGSRGTKNLEAVRGQQRIVREFTRRWVERVDEVENPDYRKIEKAIYRDLADKYGRDEKYYRRVVREGDHGLRVDFISMHYDIESEK